MALLRVLWALGVSIPLAIAFLCVAMVFHVCGMRFIAVPCMAMAAFCNPLPSKDSKHRKHSKRAK